MLHALRPKPYSVKQVNKELQTKILDHRQSLDGLHLKCLCQMLSDLIKASYHPPTSQLILQRLVGNFCHLLALFDPHPDSSLPLAAFFRDLCGLLDKPGAVQLHLNTVYSVLLGRDTTFLFEHFCQVQTELKELQRVKILPGSLDILSPWQQTVLSIALSPDRQHSWKEMYLCCRKQGKHFLDAVMVILFC